MTNEQVLHLRVTQVRNRIRLLLAQQGLCVGLTYAALAGLVLVTATRLRWWTDAVDYLWAILLAGAITGLLIGWTRRITPMVAAQIADERGDLKERLSTAVEITSREQRGEVAEAQLADAVRHAESLSVREVLPWRVPVQARWMCAAAAVLLAALFVPDLPIFQSAQERADREAMRLEGQRIQQVAKEIEKRAKQNKNDENAQIVRRIAQNMKQLGKDQARNRVTKKQALLEMNELTKELKDAEDRIAGGKAQKSLDKVASDLMQQAMRQQQSGNAEAARALQKMAENLEKRDFEGAKRQLEELAKRMQSGQMSPQDMKQAAETLQSMAQSMEGSLMAEASGQMKDAAEKLKEAARLADDAQKKLAQAKTDAERQQIQEQLKQALAQNMGQASQQTAKAGGT